MSFSKKRIVEIAKEISEEVIGDATPAQIAVMSQDEIDVIVFPIITAIENAIDDYMTGAISEALKEGTEGKEKWWE